MKLEDAAVPLVGQRQRDGCFPSGLTAAEGGELVGGRRRWRIGKGSQNAARGERLEEIPHAVSHHSPHDMQSFSLSFNFYCLSESDTQMSSSNDPHHSRASDDPNRKWKALGLATFIVAAVALSIGLGVALGGGGDGGADKSTGAEESASSSSSFVDPQPTLSSADGKLEISLHLGATGQNFGTPNFVSSRNLIEGNVFEGNVLGYAGCFSDGERCEHVRRREYNDGRTNFARKARQCSHYSFAL